MSPAVAEHRGMLFSNPFFTSRRELCCCVCVPSFGLYVYIAARSNEHGVQEQFKPICLRVFFSHFRGNVSVLLGDSDTHT